MLKQVTCRNGRQTPASSRRPGAVVVELAILIPFLAFCFVVAVDFCRIFYFIQAVQNAASTGAAYACQDSTYAAATGNIQAVAQADASNLNPAPSISTSTGTDADGNPTVSVTASYTFTTITNYPGIPSSTTISRTVTMRVCPGTSLTPPGSNVAGTSSSGS
jgi:Flp pilus assembly protein TadG